MSRRSSGSDILSSILGIAGIGGFIGLLFAVFHICIRLIIIFFIYGFKFLNIACETSAKKSKKEKKNIPKIIGNAFLGCVCLCIGIYLLVVLLASMCQ